MKEEEMVNFLLKNGAAPNIQQKDGASALGKSEATQQDSGDLQSIADDMKEKAIKVFETGRKPGLEDMQIYDESIRIKCEYEANQWHVSISCGDSAPSDIDVSRICMAFFGERADVRIQPGSLSLNIVHMFCGH